MATVPPGVPPNKAPPPVAIPSGHELLIAKLNGTSARLRAIQAKPGETPQQTRTRAFLQIAQEDLAAYDRGELSLTPQDALALRKEVGRLAQLVYGNIPMMSALPSATEQAYLADQRTRFTASFGLAVAGPVLGSGGYVANAFGASPAQVVTALEASVNIVGAAEGLTGIKPSSIRTLPGRSITYQPPVPKNVPRTEPPLYPRPVVQRVQVRKLSKAQLREEENNARIDGYLKERGHDVQANPKEGQPDAGRQGDRFVDGVKTEYKTLDPGAGANTIRNNIRRSLDNGGQARNFVIWSRGSGLTQEGALQGIQNAFNSFRGRVDSIRVIGDGFDVP